MPPRSDQLRRSSRRIKEEPDIEESTEAAQEQPADVKEASPVQIRKVDDEDDEQGDTVMRHDGGQIPLDDTVSRPPDSMAREVDVSSESQYVSNTSSQPKTRGTSAARRFQTRTGIVRKSEADRRRLEQEEAQRRQRQLVESTRGQRAAQRGPRGAPRARGTTASSTGGDRNPTSTGAQWAFVERASATPRVSLGNEQVLSELERGEQGSLSATPGAGAASETTSRVKARTSTKGKETAHDEPILENDQGINRTDIEQINLISDEDEDEDEQPALGGGRRGRHHMSVQEPGLRPIRLEKHEHVKRAVGVAANKLKTEQIVKEENANESAAGLHRARDVAVQEASDSMQIDHRALDGSATRKEVEIKAPSSPEESKPRPERKRRPSSKDRRMAYETIEEQQERLRYEEDLRKISREIGTLRSDMGMLDSGPANLSGNAHTLNDRDDKLYLFQLPPMIPMLAQQGVNQNHQTNDDNILDPADTTIVKKESEWELIENPAPVPTTDKKILTAGSDRLPPGFVGQLQVHQSGKVTLDWGGTSMLVNWGTEVDFLQDAVQLVEHPAIAKAVDHERAGGTADYEGEEAKQQREQHQTAYSLGQVREKLVVTPDWQKIYE